jgi:hypothetical protein
MEIYGEGQIGEGGCEYTYHCLSLNFLEACRFTVPPVVALLNYISCGILWRIFCQTGIFRGVFSAYSIINFVGRISAAMMAGDIIFLGCRKAYKGAMDGARGGEYNIYQSSWSSGKIYVSGSPSSGLKKREPFCFWKFRGVF